jgi:hypothetical protein
MAGDEWVLTRPRNNLNFLPCARERKRKRERKMPIRRYLGEGGFFRPQAVSVMSRALVETTEILGIKGDERKRQAVARVIVRLAGENASLDAATLRDRAVAAFGRGRTQHSRQSAAPAS